MDFKKFLATLKQETLQEYGYFVKLDPKDSGKCWVQKEGKFLACISFIRNYTQENLPVGIVVGDNSYVFFTKIEELFYDVEEKRLRMSIIDLNGEEHQIVEGIKGNFQQKLAYNLK